MRPGTEESFWAKVARHEGNACWEWRAQKSPSGYGKVTFRGRSWRAHRLAYVFEHGAIPAGLLICHHCDNPGCVRPDHLFAGESKDNSQDMVRKGRAAVGTRSGRYTKPERNCRGEASPNSKLTWDDVDWIRSLSGVATRYALAKSFGVTWSTVDGIIKGRAWPEERHP